MYAAAIICIVLIIVRCFLRHVGYKGHPPTVSGIGREKSVYSFVMYLLNLYMPIIRSSRNNLDKPRSHQNFAT